MVPQFKYLISVQITRYMQKSAGGYRLATTLFVNNCPDTNVKLDIDAARVTRGNRAAAAIQL